MRMMTKKIVTKATDGKNKVKIRISNTPNSTKIDGGVDHTTRVDFIGKSEAEKLMAKPENLPMVNQEHLQVSLLLYQKVQIIIKLELV